MNELFKQQEWLTLDDCINYLHVECNYPTLKTNLYRLALENKLILSIRFLEQVPVVIGKIIDEESYFSRTSDENTNYYNCDPRDFCDYCDSSDDSELCDDCKSFVTFSESDVLDSAEPVDDDTWFIYEGIPENIKGVWDLTMLGLESEDIEKRYQDELGECSYIPEKANDRGILIRNDSFVCKLLKKLEPSPVLEDTVFINGVVKDFLVSKGFDIDEFFDNDFNTLDSLLTPSLLDELKTRIDLMSVSLPTNKRYENCFSIEDYNHQIVIKSQELERFSESLKEGSMQETEPPAKKSYSKNSNKQICNKEQTKKKYAAWNKEAKKIKKKHPYKPKSWFAAKIAKLPIAEGKKAGTILKHLNI